MEVLVTGLDRTPHR